MDEPPATEPDETDLPDEVWARLLKGYDDPRAVATPAGFDPFEAKERFLALAQDVVRIVGAECDVEVWPFLQDATFHGLVQLPDTAAAGGDAPSVRASNFGNLITLFPSDAGVPPAVRSAVRAACDRHGYRYAPPRALRRSYTGHHAAAGFRSWADRFFGYV